MSESIVITPVNHFFDIQVLVREAIEREGDEPDDDEAPGSPCLPSDRDSTLSLLPPSPDLSPSTTANALPSLLFLDPSNALSSVTPRKKQLQKKKTDKITPENCQARKTASGNAARRDRRARKLESAQGRVIGILAGYPDNKGYPVEKRWPFLQRQAIKAFKTLRSQCWIPKESQCGHRRGNFVTLNSGVLYGGGNSLPAFKRLAGFASSVLDSWAPKLYNYYETMTDRLHEHHPDLKKKLSESIFSAVSYNFGPRTVCHPHTDPGNLAFPSAVITHSNIAISKDETHYSFAQYTAGGLFCWVDQGFRTKKEQMASLSPAELEKEKARLEGMWKFGISLLPVATVATTNHAVNK